VDYAQSLDPVPAWRTTLSSVSSSASDLLQPKNDGIRVEGFASKSIPPRDIWSSRLRAQSGARICAR
jgi:hypothetical protein